VKRSADSAASEMKRKQLYDSSLRNCSFKSLKPPTVAEGQVELVPVRAAPMLANTASCHQEDDFCYT